MICNLRLALGFVVALALAPSIQAQNTVDDAGVTESASDNLPSYASQPYGGFGLQYSQPLASGNVMMDQYGMLHDIPNIPSARPVAITRAVAPGRAFRSPSRSAPGAREPRYRLTTGSLGWTGGDGVILYSPGMRQQSYGNGYGHGPYGVTDYSHMWKGWQTD